MRKKPSISRREFIQLLLAYGFSATAAGALFSLTGCDAEESSNPTAQPTATSQSTTEALPTSGEGTSTDEPALIEEPAMEAST